MKRAIRIFLIVLLLMGALAGCQETPEKPVVVGKNNAVLIEMAQATPKPTAEPPENTDDAPTPAAEIYIDLPLGQKLQIPETYEADVSYRDGGLLLKADAAIRIPSAESMPLTRIGKADFQLPELKLLLNGLYGDAPLYWCDFPGNKAQVRKSLELHRTHLAENGKRLSATHLANVNQSITQYEAILAAIPADDLFVPWDGVMSQETPVSKVVKEYGNPQEPPDGGGPVYALQLTDVQDRDWENCGRTCFRVWTSENGFQPFINYYRRYKANPADPDDPRKREVTVGMFRRNMITPLDATEYARSFGGISITPQDAASIAGELLEPFPNMVLSDIYYADDHCDDAVIEGGGTEDIPASVEAYVLTYTQQTLHVPEIYIDGSVTDFDETKEDTVVASWGYPSLEIAINDDGILSLWWRAPTENDAVLVQDATLLSFPDIRSIFEKMALVMFDKSSDGTEVTVDGVQLGLTRIRERGNLENGLLVPAWAFYGSVVYPRDDGSPETNTYKEGSPMLIINAVDGSIIDPYKGY